MNLDADEHREHLVPQVHCCLCGLLIDSNPSNMCPNCLRAHVDVTDNIQKEYIVIYCPECERYLQPPKYWTHADLESRELLTLCLKRIKGLNTMSGSNSNSTKGKLIDAKFLWTEPHSKRIKLKLTVQKEVFNNILIQQACLIEYIVTWQQCPTCQKISTGQPQWDACVQLRQKVDHKKTFLYLEQVILKKRLHENFTKIEGQPGGLDFFFSHKSHALNFLEFLNKTAPVTRRDAVQLVSHDSKSNTAIQHYTYSLEIAPLCREDLVLLPYQDYYLKSLGGMGPLVLVHKVYSSIVFLDPKTLRAGEVTGSLYWKKPFQPLMTSREMTEFYVLECQLLPVTNGKYQLGLATVCLSTEVGEGREWIVQTHLGALLNPGDLVKGYLMESHVFNNEDLDRARYKPEQLQDVVLVRKHFPSQRAHRSRRMWKLKKLDVTTAQGDASGIVKQTGKGVRNNVTTNAYNDEAEFEDEVERDEELRKDMALYRLLDSELEARKARAAAGGATAGEAPAEEEDDGDDEAPEVPLEELLDELQLDDTNAEEAPAEEEADENVEADFQGKKKVRFE
ncbi:nonsense-mediated mRNA decay protein 3 [Strigomonas culicis]|uniref:60S ribosomal export protein NMD3 n=1 Tax=Strigomonas culicis TaxID=28005 RepID=S9UL40_9TRYP|nr:nonsense-mediated mRNA decay protein 3 [Strigomonas culicis]EPY29628.1 nonsense-mediated mRNA decay protein 3 [Strigomonas culicis]|eukprot:EPY20960.1 nonsense-mediated mRNA decay protein 3 [Strigomonas culicis]